MQKAFEPQPVFVIDGLRTVFGRRYGSLKRHTAVDLSVMVIEELLNRSKISRQLVDEVVLGNAVSAGSGQNPARQAVLRSGLRPQVPGYSVNTVCGAGLHAVALGCQGIMLGTSQVVIAGGAASASNNPQIMAASVQKPSIEDLQDSLVADGLTCAILGRRMGDIVEDLAAKHKISRERQDAFALESQRRAYQSYRKRLDAGEVMAVAATKSRVQDMDEAIRKNSTAEILMSLPPVFGVPGTVTAGNSSAACDGAAAVLLAGSAMVRKYAWKPMAKVLGFVHIAVEPQNTFEAPVEAVKACLRRTGVSLNSIDVFEISEAFAAEMVFIRDTLKISDEKLNVWGGDLAIGHPLGAAGARTLVTLIKIMNDRQLKRGLCAVAYGGGGAVAMIVENCRLDAPLFAKK